MSGFLDDFVFGDDIAGAGSAEQDIDNKLNGGDNTSTVANDLDKITDTGSDDLPTFKPLAQAWFEENEWEWDEEIDKIDLSDMKGFNKLVGQIIKENSEPQFENETAREFYEFISKGGDPADFQRVVFDLPDYENLDHEDLETKKSIIKDYMLATTKFDEKKITKTIGLYEKENSLDEEFKEALPYMVKYRNDEKARIESEIEAKRAAEDAKINGKVADMVTRLEGLDRIEDIELDAKEKKAFKQWAFEKDKTGKTGYASFISSKPNWDLEMMYLAYKGASGIARDAQTKASNKLTNLLNSYSNAPSGRSVNPRSGKGEEIDYNDFVL